MHYAQGFTNYLQGQDGDILVDKYKKMFDNGGI